MQSRWEGLVLAVTVKVQRERCEMDKWLVNVEQWSVIPWKDFTWDDHALIAPSIHPDQSLHDIGGERRQGREQDRSQQQGVQRGAGRGQAREGQGCWSDQGRRTRYNLLQIHNNNRGTKKEVWLWVRYIYSSPKPQKIHLINPTCRLGWVFEDKAMRTCTPWVALDTGAMGAATEGGHLSL